jgi:hypothetical protein
LHTFLENELILCWIWNCLVVVLRTLNVQKNSSWAVSCCRGRHCCCDSQEALSQWHGVILLQLFILSLVLHFVLIFLKNIAIYYLCTGMYLISLLCSTKVWFLGTFAKLWKWLLVSSCLSVCVSVCLPICLSARNN